MSTLEYAVIIPARYQSSRLPGKPLVNLCGLPMVVRTYRQCIKACPAERVYVATEDERIAAACRVHNIQVLMTSPECLTGTDRVAECASQVGAEVLINVQGDEPVLNPRDLSAVIASLNRYPGEIINGFCSIDNEKMFRSESIPKVVMRPDGRLLYMSRSPIPGNKQHMFLSGRRQVCIYAFPKAALAAFAEQKRKTPLEEQEDIEILRFLELGWEVRMLEMSADSVAVDNPDDVALAEMAIRKRGL